MTLSTSIYQNKLKQDFILSGKIKDFDLLSKIDNSTELMNIIKKRWNQIWIYEYKEEISITSFEKDNIDDICIGIWYN